MTDRAFLTDLDGTLLLPDASLSVYTIETVSKLLNMGVKISYATARSYRSSNQAVSCIPWKYPIVLYNGALLYDPVAHQVIDGYWLSPVFTNELLEIGRRHQLLPLLFALTSLDEEAVVHEPLVRAGDRHFYASRPDDPRFREVIRLVCPADYKVLILTYIGLFEELEPLSKEFANKYGANIHIHFLKDIYIEDHYFLEISHAKANKREGLLLWSRLMGVEPSDVTVFGDQLNDIGMFELAGTKVAVGNAHPELKALADVVVTSNEEDAVAHYLSDQFAVGQ
jgi:Cof subfamily protein (haloacid dehalogenase superfamily)